MNLLIGFVTGSFLVIVILISKLRQAYERERLLSRKDFLTGVANRQAFFEIAAMELERSRRFGRPFSLAYLGCDNFKNINDKFGYRAGDNLLRYFAATIQNNIRASDLIARVGDDEFAILFSEAHSKQSQRVITRIQKILLEGMHDEKWATTFSIGLATFLKPQLSLVDMLQKAGNLMFTARGNGSDKIEQGIFE